MIVYFDRTIADHELIVDELKKDITIYIKQII